MTVLIKFKCWRIRSFSNVPNARTSGISGVLRSSVIPTSETQMSKDHYHRETTTDTRQQNQKKKVAKYLVNASQLLIRAFMHPAN